MPASSRVVFHGALRFNDGATLCSNITIGQPGELVTGAISQRAACLCVSKSLPVRCNYVVDITRTRTYTSACQLAAVLECDQIVRDGNVFANAVRDCFMASNDTEVRHEVRLQSM